ncbi:alpha-L-rhamnosidase [Opitutaceae bacterium TAV5]|nr:alpha-L-rhamnosidase [Opitutaceae bacterium TAV5]
MTNESVTGPAREARIFGHARWIWPENHQWDIRNGYALFRKVFELPARSVSLPEQAPLFITADQSYRLFVNGIFVARGPARGYQESWPYDEIDIAAHLQPGRNVIAVRAWNPGFGTFQYVSQGFAGLLVAARWEDAGVVIGSDTTWKTIRQPGVTRDTVTSSIQLFPQEHIDLRSAPVSADASGNADWTAPDFDDGDWLVPEALRWNCAPWFSLEPRGIPQLVERSIVPAALLGSSEGLCATGYPDVRDVVALRRGEDRSHRVSEMRKPQGEGGGGAGRYRSFLFDFGRTVVGSLVLTIRGAGGGEIIDTHLGETIDADTLTIDQYDPTWCRMAFGDRLVCRAGDFTYRFFHHYGFRYLDLTVRDALRDDLQIEVSLDWIGYPLESRRAGRFLSSDATLDRIWEACAWTQQCCSLDAYVDTPWREQAQWWGDARVQAWNTFHLVDDARLFRRGIAQIAHQTTPDGLTYGHAPTMAHGCILPDFTLIWFLTLWDYYWQTGSTEPLTTHRETVRRALAYFREHTDSRTGLLRHDERFWLFLDWTELGKEGSPAVYNLWLLIALEKLAILHRHAGLPDEAAPLDAWAARLRHALRPLVTEEGFLCDGFDTEGISVSTTSLHTQTLALVAGLEEVDGIDEQAILEKILLPFIRGEQERLPASAARAIPSAYWITYVFSLLIGRGHGEEVVAFIKDRWLPMAEHGTTWELFSPRRGEESHSHAWSAHPLFHLMRTLGGITQTAPAWREIDWHPVFHGDHAEVAVPTPHGLIRSTWERGLNGDAGTIRASLLLPPGVAARVRLPGEELRIVTGEFSCVFSGLHGAHGVHDLATAAYE